MDLVVFINKTKFDTQYLFFFYSKYIQVHVYLFTVLFVGSTILIDQSPHKMDVSFSGTPSFVEVSL